MHVELAGGSVEILSGRSKHKYLGKTLVGDLRHWAEVELGHRLQVTWAKVHKHRHVLTNKHVALKLRLKFFDSALSPTVLFGLATIGRSPTENAPNNCRVGGGGFNWLENNTAANEWKTGHTLRLYPISLWGDAIFRTQFRLSARVCRHLERWPAAATFWNPPEIAEAYFTNQPFRKRGRPQVRWDDNLRKFGEMQFQQKTWSIPARHTALWRSFENEYVHIVKRLHCKLMVLICLVS